MSPAVLVGEPTPLQRYLILAAVVFGSTLYATTILVVSVILPQMQGSLSATPDQIAWVMTFNIVATAMATPMTGWLTATFGRRNVMVWGMAGFTLATLACGLSTSLEALVLFRVIQGLTGAPLTPLSQAVVLDVFPKHLAGRATAIYGMAVVIGPIIGPIVGGEVTEMYDWHAAFLVLVPVCMLAVVLLWYFVPDGTRREPVRLDWTGFLALMVAVMCVQLMLDRGERLDWFESPEIVIEATAAALAFWIFLTHSVTTDRPFINLRHLLDRNYSIGLVLVTIYGMLNFLPMIILPPMLQNLLGFPNSTIGFLLAWRGAGAVLAYVLIFASTFVVRPDPRIGLCLGFGIQAYSGWIMMQFGFETSVSTVALCSFLQGIAVATIWTPLVTATFATLEPRFLPETTSIFHLLRNLGSSAYISVSVAIVLRTGGMNYSQLTEFVTPLNPIFSMPDVVARWDIDTLAGLTSIGNEIARQAEMIGYLNAFAAFTFVNLAAIPLVLTVRGSAGRGR